MSHFQSHLATACQRTLPAIYAYAIPLFDLQRSANLQVPCPLLTLSHPPLKRIPVSCTETTLKWLWVRRQTRRNGVTLQAVQDWLILLLFRRINVEGCDQSDKCGVEFSVCKMRTSTHARSGTIGIVWRTRAFGVLEVAFYVEFLRVFEVGFIEVGSPCILEVALVVFYSQRKCTYHIECCSCWDDGVFVFDVLDTCARETNGNDGKESQNLSHESSDIWYLLFHNALLPCVTVGVDLHNFFVGSLLDFLSMM